MAEEFVFNQEIMQTMKAFKYKFVIGVDTSNEKCLTYCFSKHAKDGIEILLLKKMNDNVLFEEEVSNLQKYFDAVVVREY